MPGSLCGNPGYANRAPVMINFLVALRGLSSSIQARDAAASDTIARNWHARRV